MRENKVYHKTDDASVYVVSSNYFVKCSTQMQQLFNNLNKHTGDLSKKLRYAIEKSKPHPLIYDLISSPVESVMILNRSGISQYQNLHLFDGSRETEWIAAFADKFWPTQYKLVQENLKNCSKSAWIVPLHYAKEMATFLRKLNLYSNVGT